jgi:hypothetical protein
VVVVVVLVVATSLAGGCGAGCGASAALAGMRPRMAKAAKMTAAVRVFIGVLLLGMTAPAKEETGAGSSTLSPAEVAED